jgi:hypothetical protein
MNAVPGGKIKTGIGPIPGCGVDPDSLPEGRTARAARTNCRAPSGQHKFASEPVRRLQAGLQSFLYPSAEYRRTAFQHRFISQSLMRLVVL